MYSISLGRELCSVGEEDKLFSLCLPDDADMSRDGFASSALRAVNSTFTAQPRTISSAVSSKPNACWTPLEVTYTSHLSSIDFIRNNRVDSNTADRYHHALLQVGYPSRSFIVWVTELQYLTSC